MPQQKRRQKYLKICSLILGVAVISSFGGSTVLAQQSQLQQQITEPDCSQPGACDMAPPTIEDVDKNGGKPIFEGQYDAAFTQKLRVIFGGRAYTLGVDSELTVQGTTWQLDLSGLSPPLIPGKYELVVEATDFSGEVKSAAIFVVFKAADIKPDPGDGGNVADPNDPSRPVPSAPNTGLLRRSVLPALAALGGAGLLAGMILVLRRKNLRS